MNAFRRWRQAFLAALLLALTLTAWALFAPQQAGGNAAYVLIIGNSMEPGFRRGDLVIVRRAPLYQVGEAVAYRDPQLQRYIFHRVIAQQGEYFLLQGDNNDWTDSYRPRASEILGKQWIHLPGFGRAVQWLRRPLVLGTAAGLATGGLAAIFLLRPSRRKRNSTGESSRNEVAMNRFLSFLQQLRARWQGKAGCRLTRRLPEDMIASTSRHLGSLLEILFFVFGLSAFLALILGIFAFRKPLERLATDDVEYRHQGLFAYTATAPAGVYDAPQVTSGQPVFPKLSCLLNLNFDYALTGPSADVNGTYTLHVQVRDERSGWERSILIQPETPFAGQTYSAKNTVNLCSAVSMAEILQEKTDYRNVYYTFVIAPVVTVRGTIAGRPLEDTFAPKLTFNFDSLLFYLRREDEESNPLVAEQINLLPGWKAEPNTMSLFGKAFPVLFLRRLAVGIFALSLVALAVPAWFLAALARRGQTMLNRVKYESLLVELNPNSEPPAAPLIEVASLDDLARLAERHGQAILYQNQQPLHYYFVYGSGAAYRYALNEPSGGVLTAPLIQLEGDLRRALNRQEFEVYYQPIVSLAKRTIVGVEALLRWRHPQHGLLAPLEFLAAAEATGLIEPIGEWVFQAIGVQYRAWEEAGLSLQLAVNLSVRQLSPARIRRLRHLLEASGLPMQQVHVEVAEERVLDRIEEIAPCLQELDESGIQVTLDDFTGRIPILGLERLPIRSIKLDRPFVARSLNQQEGDRVRRSIQAARGWGLEVIAEGVEEEQELDFLLSTPCRLGQGYLFGRPMPADQIMPILQGKRSSSSK